MMSVIRGDGGEPEIVGELGDSREVGREETWGGGIHKVGEPESGGDTFEGTGQHWFVRVCCIVAPLPL
jgi:hypothetical protein